MKTLKPLLVIMMLSRVLYAETVYIQSESLSKNQFEAYVRMTSDGLSYANYIKDKLFIEKQNSYSLLSDYQNIISQSIKVNRAAQLSRLENNIFSEPLTPFRKELLKKVYDDLSREDKSKSQKWKLRKELISHSPSEKRNLYESFKVSEIFPDADILFVNGFELSSNDTIYLTESTYQVAIISNRHLESVQILNLSEIKNFKSKSLTLIASGHCLAPEFSQIPIEVFHKSQVIYSADCQVSPSQWGAKKENLEVQISQLELPQVKKNNTKWVIPAAILSAVAMYYINSNYDIEWGYVK